MTMAMELIRHIAGLYSGKAIKGDFTQVYISGNEIWMAQQILASQHTEQAEGAQGERDGWGESPVVKVPWNVFDRAVMWVEDRRRYGDDGTIVEDWKALKAIQRDALAQPSPKCPVCKDSGIMGHSDLCVACAQPSPAPELPERGTQHRFSTSEQTCRHDFSGVWWNDKGVTKTGRECRHCGFFVADMAEAPEQPKRYTADVFYHNHFSTVQMEVVRASHFDEFAAQSERIVEALRADLSTLIEVRNGLVEEIGELHSELADVREERDDALARLAELGKQKEFGRVIVSMKGGYKCFEFDEYSHAHSYPEGEHQLYAAPVAQAGQVPDGYMLITQDQVERHATTAWECPPQSRVVLVSTLKRLHEKNGTAPQTIGGK